MDGDFKSAVDGIKNVIGKIDGPLTSLMMNPDFEAFTLIDTMKIFEGKHTFIYQNGRAKLRFFLLRFEI